jgi:biopolymer transport protein ExbB
MKINRWLLLELFMRRLSDRSVVMGWLGCLLLIAVMAGSSLAWQEAPAATAAVDGAAPAGPVAPAPVGAAPAPAGAAEGGRPQKNWLSWTIEACGIFFYPQLAIMVAIVAIIGTNAYGVLRSRFINGSFVENFETLTKSKQYKEAFEAAKADQTFLGRIVSAGLGRLSDGYPDALAGMQEAGTAENMKNEHRLSYLSMLANIATMVGLLGTVAGMVASFTVLSTSDVSPSPSALAQGVSMALVTTVIGLIEAIPAIIAFTILGNLNSRRVLEVAQMGEHLMRPFRQVSVAKRPAAADGSAGQVKPTGGAPSQAPTAPSA